MGENGDAQAGIADRYGQHVSVITMNNRQMPFKGSFYTVDDVARRLIG
jgi:hypothetical protein